MITLFHIKRAFPAIFAWLLFTLAACGQTTSRLSSCFLARGEQALLEISYVGSQPDGFPELPTLKNVQLQPSGRGLQTRMFAGRKVEYIFEYIVSSYEVGNYAIPPVKVMVGGVEYLTDPLDFQVFNPDELQWSEVEVDGRPLRYASSFRTMNVKPYEGETTYTEMKVFVPRELAVEDWGIPDFQRDGLAAWRFQPSLMRSSINLLGQGYISVAYPSTITPTRVGKNSIGPAKTRLKTIQVIRNPFPERVYADLYLDIPKLQFETQSLPDGAPAGFENAVGSFRISASTSATEVKEGDPISVDLIVNGSGNLDTMRPPKLLDSAGWKIYEATTDQRGDERRQLSGMTVFHQFMRPLELKPTIPSFQLVYFDPKEEIYKTVTTEPIALNMIPNAAAKVAGASSQVLPVPLERMTDILGLIKPAQLTITRSSAIPSWAGHAVAALIALCLILKILWKKYAHRLRRNPASEAKSKALRELQLSKKSSDIDFLKSAGAFIETHLGQNVDPELQAILTERDTVCFRAQKPDSVIDHNRRDSIMKTLRRATMAALAIAALALTTTPVRAGDHPAAQAVEAYESAKYDEAIKLWLGAGDYHHLSADTLYHIGNACYRSGAPGYGALYYRRALSRDPSHEESRQNLRFIERKYGAITIQRPDFQYALAKLPLTTWKAILWTGAWLAVIGLLTFPATRPGARIRLAATAALAIAPLLASVGALGWRYFPTDYEFAPPDKQAVVIADKAVLHADASRTSPEVIDAPPGSLCEIIRESGRWVYVAFATKTRGWIPAESLEKVIPEKPAEAPKFHKPKADAKTA